MDATGQQPRIRLRGVGKTYDDGTIAVQELDLDVAEGELVVLVGPSGCGKSTTLKMINRLIEPTTGRIEIDGRDVTDVDPVELRRSIGYVIQQVGLFPHQRVTDNVMTVPVLVGEPKSRARSRAEELLELVGLDPSTYGRRFPHQLSGGQRQRVGVARALAADPPVLLMDEPFGAVDPVVRVRLQEEFLRLQRELGKSTVMVTHDIDEAVLMGDRVAVFAEGGRLAQFGTPAELLSRPADDFVADFVGAEKGLRRLSVVPLALEHLEPMDGVADAGRLFVRGPNVMKGYLNADANAAFQALGGWYDTGDIIHVDADGYFWVRGRAKRFAKVSGEMVSLTAVEDALAGAFPQHGEECEVAVVALPDAEKGERLVAVTNEPKLELAEIREAITAAGLTNLYAPRDLQVVDELPKLGTGKLNHREVLQSVKPGPA